MTSKANDKGESQPDQDPEERREIRNSYRELINDVTAKKPELIDEPPLRLKEFLDQTNILFAKVTHTREAALDAQCVSSIANIGRQKIEALSTGFDSFSIIEFCQKLVTRLRGDAPSTESEEAQNGEVNGLTPENWIQLGSACQTFFKRSPTLHFMFGSFDREPGVPRVKSARPARGNGLPSDNVVADKPKQTNSFNDPEDQNNRSKDEVTTLAVEAVFRVLQKWYRKNNCTPICFFELVVNPESFSQTIENVFHTSFLIKDGHARVFMDEDGLPVIEPVQGVVNGNDGDNDHQMVMAWTMEGWRDIVQNFNIERPLIPTRQSKKS